MTRVRLKSVPEVITALDGIAGVATLTGSQPKSVSAWQTVYGRFPAKTYVVMTKALAALGLTADDSLWGMTLPAAAKKGGKKRRVITAAMRRKTASLPFRGGDAAQR